MVSFSVTEMLSQASMALVPIRMYSLETVQEFKPLGHPQFWLNINRFSTYWKYVLSKNFLCTRKFILHFGEFYVSFLEWGYTNSIFVGTFICTLMKYFIENVLQIWHDLAKKPMFITGNCFHRKLENHQKKPHQAHLVQFYRELARFAYVSEE